MFTSLHFHWGERAGEGTEHLVDGIAEELEIHFVLNKISGDGEPISVVAVRARVDSSPISGVFAELDASQISVAHSSISVSVVLSDLLPSNRNYYSYLGSLTTPACDEIVQWYVLQHTIAVPSAYLTDLRKIESDQQGTLLTFNFRDTQDLNNREVTCFEVSELT